MPTTKNIALVAHDHRKRDLVDWVETNFPTIIRHNLICTGTTGRLIEATLQNKLLETGQSGQALNLIKLKSGPLGGDQQLGAMIAEGRIDMIIFLWDPMEPHPHDVDVKALLRIAVVYNIPIACNRATADYVVSSPLINQEYKAITVDFSDYVNRPICP